MRSGRGLGGWRSQRGSSGTFSAVVVRLEEGSKVTVWCVSRGRGEGGWGGKRTSFLAEMDGAVAGGVGGGEEGGKAGEEVVVGELT